MNSAFNDKQAIREASRPARVTLRAVLACALVLGSGLTFAQQQHDRDYGTPPPEHRSERFRLPQMERDPRQAEAQMRGYEEQRRMQQYQQPAAQPSYPPQTQDQPRPRSSGRMTADERAEMRRQVNEAKDFYPQRR